MYYNTFLVAEKVCSCGSFSFAVLYIHACGSTASSTGNYVYGHDSCIFISPNINSISIYAPNASSLSQVGIYYKAISDGSVNSSANSISVSAAGDYYFINGAVICFNLVYFDTKVLTPW